MPRPAHLHPADLHGISRMTLEAVVGLIDLVEGRHRNAAGILLIGYLFNAIL